MIEEAEFETLEDFMYWWADQNPEDDLNTAEMASIFFNLDTYNVGNI